MPKLTRKVAILAKIETTYGVNSIPTGSANAIQVINPEITPIAAETVNREIARGYLGNSEELIANKHVEVNFGVEIVGAASAGAAAPYSPLLRACGLSETLSSSPAKVIYAPVSQTFESVTLFFYLDGIHHKITGVRGTVSFEIEANKIPMMMFKFIGIYDSIVDGGMPTTVYTDWNKPNVSNTTYTYGFNFLGNTALTLEKLTVDLGNDVLFRSLIGSEYAMISDRKVSGTATFEATTLATFNVFQRSLETTNGILEITHNDQQSRKFKIEMASVDIGTPTYADSSGVVMWTVPFNGIPVSGNDEINLTTF